ncbi:nicotinamide riboside transporter PnuC [Thalassotalea ganghwensis]
MSEVLQYYAAMPVLEWLAVISSLLYVVLAAHNNIWCWPAAFVSTLLYTLIFYHVYLWSDSLLQLYYLVMALFGWWAWRKGDTSERPDNTIKQWSLLFHCKAVVILTIVSLIVGKLMAEYTPTHFPYLDAATTVFAVFTTYLVTQRVLENWYYWLVIDAVSIYLYWQKALYPTVLLFALFVIFAVYGLFKWQSLLKEMATDKASDCQRPVSAN